MASATVQPTPAPAPPPGPPSLLASSARTMFIGLLWGGALLIILAFWLGLKLLADERSLVLPWIIGIAGGGGLALAGWHAFTLWLQKVPPEQKAAALASQRRVTALALLAGGAALVVIAFILGFAPRPGVSGTWATLRGSFGEAVGLCLFALVALGAGKTLLSPPRDAFTTIDLEPMRGLFPLIRTALFLVGIVLILVFAILVFHQRVGWTYFPELAGMLMFSMLCVALGMWLISVPAPDPFATRVFVLTFGGTTGLILFVMTMARAIAWRQQVFFSGMAVWQGEEGWQLWLVVYLQMIALALMFGSLLLARADIRANAVLRRMLYGYNAVLNGLLVVEMLIVLNIVAYAVVPYTFDWTKTRGLHALAQASKNLLHKLKQPTHIYVLMSQGMATQADVRTLLENVQAESNNVEVRYISPDRERDLVEYGELAKKFPKILPASAGKGISRDQDSGRGILVIYGPMPKAEEHKVPYAFIPERKVYDEQPGMHGQRPSRSFKGEIELMSELNYLVHGGEKRKLYFLQGDNEIDIYETEAARRTDPRGEMSLLGAAMLVDRLKKDNYDVQGITFSKEYAKEKEKDKIQYIGPTGPDKKLVLPDPKDTHAIVIAGASSQIPVDALAALEDYVKHGGKLMVMFDIVLTKDFKVKDIRNLKLRESGLEEMLKRYGIESTDEIAGDQPVGAADFRPLIRTTSRRGHRKTRRTCWPSSFSIKSSGSGGSGSSVRRPTRAAGSRSSRFSRPFPANALRPRPCPQPSPCATLRRSGIVPKSSMSWRCAASSMRGQARNCRWSSPSAKTPSHASSSSATRSLSATMQC